MTTKVTNAVIAANTVMGNNLQIEQLQEHHFKSEFLANISVMDNNTFVNANDYITYSILSSSINSVQSNISGITVSGNTLAWSNTNVSTTSNIYFIGQNVVDPSQIDVYLDGIYQVNDSWVLNAANDTIQFTEPNFPSGINVSIEAQYYNSDFVPYDTDKLLAQTLWRGRYGRLPLPDRPLFFNINDNYSRALINLTRSNLASFITSNGYIDKTTGTADVTRYTFDGGSLEPEGLLIEPQRRNLSKNGTVPVSWGLRSSTVTVNDALAPDGTITAVRVNATATTDIHVIRKVDGDPAIEPNTYYCFSVFAKASTTHKVFVHTPLGSGVGANALYAMCNLIDGSTSSLNSSNLTHYGSEIYPNGWKRFWGTAVSPITTSANPAASELTLGLMPNNAIFSNSSSWASNSINTCAYFWGAMIEKVGSPFDGPTSLITSNGAAITKQADISNIALSNFGNFNSNGYSVIAEIELLGSNGILFGIAHDNYFDSYVQLDKGKTYLKSSNTLLNVELSTNVQYGSTIVAGYTVTDNVAIISVDGNSSTFYAEMIRASNSSVLQLASDLTGSNGCPIILKSVSVLGTLSNTEINSITGG